MLGEFILAALTFTGTLAAGLAVYFWYQGDSIIVFETDAAHNFQISKNDANREIYCRCLIPLVNKGKQNGMVINALCQPSYCGKIMSKLEIIPRIHLYQEPPKDSGYWEAVIIKKNSKHLAELEVKIRSLADLERVIRDVQHLTIIIHYQTVGRDGIQWKLAEVKFDLAQLQIKQKG